MSAIAGNPASPANEAVAITPADAGVISPASRALFIGVGGDVTVDMQKGGTNITFKNVPSGSTLPIAVTRVYATGTTATNIVALL